MSKVFQNELYAVIRLLHRETGCFHLIVTAVSPSQYKPSQTICYFNDFAKRTHKIVNYALREFVVNYRDLAVEDFSVTVLGTGLLHKDAKLLCRKHAFELGLDKLLTAHVVHPTEWELNKIARGRIRDNIPPSYIPPEPNRKRRHNPELIKEISVKNSAALKAVPLHLRVEIVRAVAENHKKELKQRFWITADADGFTGWLWEKKNVPLRIVCAANMYGDMIIPGARHYCVMMGSVIDLVGLDALHSYAGPDGYQQGFIDQYGNFHTREAAMALCVEQGRPLLNELDSKILFSEYLY